MDYFSAHKYFLWFSYQEFSRVKRLEVILLLVAVPEKSPGWWTVRL